MSAKSRQCTCKISKYEVWEKMLQNKYKFLRGTLFVTCSSSEVGTVNTTVFEPDPSLRLTLSNMKEFRWVTNRARNNFILQSFMFQSDIVLSLPVSVSCNILRDWLNLKSVIRLDSSFCCTANRQGFEDLLQSNEYFVRERIALGPRLIGFNGRNSGLSKFGEKIRSVNLNGMLSADHGRSAATLFRNLTHVHYVGPDCPPSVLCDILRTNGGVEYLDMCIYGYGSIPGAELLSLEGISLLKLRTLIIAGCRYEIDPLVDFLIMRSSIAQLDLRAATLNKRKIVIMQQLGTSLTSLNLASCTLPSEDALGSLASSCRNIHHLNIGNVATTEYGFGVTDAGILAVVQNLKGLESVRA